MTQFQHNISLPYVFFDDKTESEFKNMFWGQELGQILGK